MQRWNWVCFEADESLWSYPHSTSNNYCINLISWNYFKIHVSVVWYWLWLEILCVLLLLLLSHRLFMSIYLMMINYQRKNLSNSTKCDAISWIYFISFIFGLFLFIKKKNSHIKVNLFLISKRKIYNNYQHYNVNTHNLISESVEKPTLNRAYIHIYLYRRTH